MLIIFLDVIDQAELHKKFLIKQDYTGYILFSSGKS